METISRAVENGKDRGLTDQEIEAAVCEGMVRHERRQNATPGRDRQPGASLAATSLGGLGVSGPSSPTAPALEAAGPAVAGPAEGARPDREHRIYCDPEIGQ
jgi:hypothetical protein